MKLKDKKIQTGLRIPKKQYDRLEAHSKDIGVSINALVLIMIEQSLKCLDCGCSEFGHASAHNPLNTA